jgi:hypothetical protein
VISFVPLNAILFNQQCVSSLDCPHCVGEIEDINHKYRTCRQTRDLWTFTQNHTIRKTGKLVTFVMVIYPEFQNFTRDERLTSMKILPIYINFIAKINIENRNILQNFLVAVMLRKTITCKYIT